MQEPPTDNPRATLIKYASFCLNRRPYFRDTLRHKLLQRSKKLKLEDTGEVINDILDDLQKSGFLDDAYLAEAFVRRQLAKSYGPKVISLKLRKLHLTHSTIKDVIAGISTQDLLEATQKYADKYSHLDSRKLYSKLYSRGFDSSSIRKLFDVDCFED